MPRIKDWKFVNFLGEFCLPKVDNLGPEHLQTRLFGKVFDDKRANNITTEFIDGHRIITSPISKINLPNRNVITRSGTNYILNEEPDQEWLEWLQKQDDGKQYKDQIHQNYIVN